MLIRVADRSALRWANGGGETRELIVGYAPGETSFSWRISVATIARSGLFSRYEGVDRSLVVLDGSALALAIGEKRVAVDAGKSIRFRGEDAVSAQTGPNPVRVLNIMTRRLRAAHTVSIDTVSADIDAALGSYAIAHAPCTIGEFQLAVGDLLTDSTRITGAALTNSLVFVTIING